MRSLLTKTHRSTFFRAGWDDATNNFAQRNEPEKHEYDKDSRETRMNYLCDIFLLWSDFQPAFCKKCIIDQIYEFARHVWTGHARVLHCTTRCPLCLNAFAVCSRAKEASSFTCEKCKIRHGAADRSCWTNSDWEQTDKVAWYFLYNSIDSRGLVDLVLFYSHRIKYQFSYCSNTR